MKDLDLFKKRYLSHNRDLISCMSVRFPTEEEFKRTIVSKAFFDRTITYKDTIYLSAFQNQIGGTLDYPEFEIKICPVCEVDLPRLMAEYYYVRCLKVGTPVFAKRVFPEWVVDPKEHSITVKKEEKAADILRKVFDALGVGLIKADKRFVDDAKECNNRITELNVWSDQKKTEDIISEIFSDYVTVIIEDNSDVLIP